MYKWNYSEQLFRENVSYLYYTFKTRGNKISFSESKILKIEQIIMCNVRVRVNFLKNKV